MAKVSICIPCYNNADEVKRLLESIYTQEYTDFEVNISDDSTNEETAEVAAKFQIKYGREQIHYIHNEKGLGHIFNWNAAVKMATGEYIKIMFSDDWFTDSTSLGKFVSLLDENPQVMLAFCGSRQVMLDDSVKHVTREHVKSSYDRHASKDFIDRLRKDYRNLFLGNEIGTPSASIYRRGKELSLFDEQSNWASDMFLYFTLLEKSSQFAYTKEPLICVGVHENQYTETFSEKDMRIYNDYRYMYTKYQLQESKACQEYFAKQFIIKYHKGRREARALGISGSLYWRKWFAEQGESVKCFLNARIQRISAKRD